MDHSINFEDKRDSRKGKTFPPEPLTQGEVTDLLSTFTRCPSGRRNKALVTLLWRAGLRIAEALALKVKDVDLDSATVTVLRGKGSNGVKKRRVVGLDLVALQALELWIPIALEYSTGDKWLFPLITKGTDGRAMSAASARLMLREKRVKAGIDKRVVPHGLRHTLGRELAVDPDVSTNSIKDVFGHSSLATTDIYITGLCPTIALDDIRNRKIPEGLDNL